MKKISLFAGLLTVVSLSSAKAQDTTYNWTGTSGFTAQITLDSPSSSSGSLSDIVSIYVEDPANDGGPWGPFANYPTTITIPYFGTFPIPAEEFDSTDAAVTGDFSWNANQITSMDLTWQFGVEFLTLTADPTAGSSIDYQNWDVPIDVSDNTGLYVATGASAPDGGSTALFLSAALAGTALLFCKRNGLAQQ